MSVSCNNANRKADCFCIPEFVRSSGLGNRLFPWARCSLFSRDTCTPMLAPEWSGLRRGPLLRGGVDYSSFMRKIWLYDNFHSTKYIAGSARKSILRQYCRITENQYFSKEHNVNKVVIVFKGDGLHFNSLIRERKFIENELRCITKKKWIDFVNQFHDLPVVANIRVGKDFKKAGTEEDYYTRGGILTPLEWYIKVIERIREALQYCVKVHIISDGSRSQLLPVLMLPNVVHIRTKSAICDLLLAAKAKFFIASGGSSFSAWAAYLSSSPTITHPGQCLSWFGLPVFPSGNVGVFSPDQPDPSVLLAAKQALHQYTNQS